jgi:hypothetical protein
MIPSSLDVLGSFGVPLQVLIKGMLLLSLSFAFNHSMSIVVSGNFWKGQLLLTTLSGANVNVSFGIIISLICYNKLLMTGLANGPFVLLFSSYINSITEKNRTERLNCAHQPFNATRTCFTILRCSHWYSKYREPSFIGPIKAVICQKFQGVHQPIMYAIFPASESISCTSKSGAWKICW